MIIRKIVINSVIISDTLTMKSIYVEGGFFLWKVEFFKIHRHDFMFIRKMRVHLVIGSCSILCGKKEPNLHE